jgi:Txe/YoeB family toxin of toxin-antitoxin system
MYKVELTKQAVKDAKLIERAGMKSQAAELLVIIRENPYQNPPEYEKLQGYKDAYSRRINRKHRLVYHVQSNVDSEKDENSELYQGVVKVVRMWTHYE